MKEIIEVCAIISSSQQCYEFARFQQNMNYPMEKKIFYMIKEIRV